MGRDEAYYLLGKLRPDTLMGTAEYFFNAAMLGTSGTCSIRFDSLNRVTIFYFKAIAKFNKILKDNCILAFGLPDDTAKNPLNGSLTAIQWHQAGAFYNFNDNSKLNRCSLYGCSEQFLKTRSLDEPRLPSSPIIKSSLTLWIDMPRAVVYKQLGAEHPDSLGADGYEFFLHVKLLKESGFCAVKFDSAGKLIHFYFVTSEVAWSILVKNALYVFGQPSEHGPWPQTPKQYDQYWWKFNGENYSLWQRSLGCMFGGDKPLQMPTLAPLNVPPPP